MRFFSDIGEQAFRTAPDGRRLFYSFGPWSRPYVVPDSQTEQRLSHKQRWLIGIMLVLVVVGQEIVRGFEFAPVDTVAGLLGYVAFVWLGYVVVRRILFHSELGSLVRAESRLSFHDYYADVAARRSLRYMLVQIGLSLALVALGVELLVVQNQPVLGWTGIVLFTLTAAVWLYPLGLKLTHQGR